VAVVLAVSLLVLPSTGAYAWAELGPVAADTDWLFEDDTPDPADRDPLEPLNRAFFGFNERLYGWVVDPFATAYQFVMPGPGRRAVRRFFLNLSEPVTIVNDLLQLRPVEATSSSARFVINSTAGVAGLFDPAAAWGIDRHTSDFGETLAVYRVGSGPYLVIPVMGPSTVRDAIGGIVDGLIRPDTWLLTPGTRLVISASDGFTSYEIERERLDALRDTSVDFYAALRSAYLMDRDARVRALFEPDCPETPEVRYCER
jgi:phospholipid-binding lipoprotein MlaA